MTTPERRPDEAVPYGVRVAAAWTWRLLVVAVGLYVLTRIFFRIELVAFSFVLALFFTAVLHPLERFLRRVPGPRSVSAGLAVLIGIAVLAGIGYFVAWQISNHATELGDQISKLADQVRDWLKNGPLKLESKDLNKITDDIKKSVQQHQAELITGAIETVRTVVEVLGALLLILLSTFFLLRDGDQIWRWTLRLTPTAAHERLDTAGRVGWRTLGGYMRGQLLIALFHGVTVTILLFALQVPLAGALGVLIFLGSFIPLVGLTVSGALCVAVTLLEHGVGAAIFVAATIIVLVQVEAHFLQPFIMSRSVEVHPLAIALSVLTGTVLAGIVGALLAVPLVAFLNATIHALRASPALPMGESGFPVKSRKEVGGDPVDMAEPPAGHPDESDGPDDSDESDEPEGVSEGEGEAEGRS